MRQKILNFEKNYIYFGFFLINLIVYSILYSANKFYDPKRLSTKLNKLEKNTEINEKFCSPIDHKFKQYQIEIENNEKYPKRIPLSKNKTINFDCLNKNKIIKRILLWNKFGGDDSFGIKYLGEFEPFKKNNCPVTNCELINNKQRINQSDYVIVHIGEKPYDNIPKYRPSNQQWIFFLHESPINIYENLSKFKNTFNLTFTYRFDSDIMSFYYYSSSMEWEPNDEFDLEFDHLVGKKYFAAALISNCNDKSGRINYINELKKYVSVELFGKCGKKCPDSKTDCREMIMRSYKFYLSFENSICKDYITEKFFMALKYSIIPVVLGGGQYDYYVPKSAYINVKDFKSARELANYLTYLDKNSTAYNSYFKWKKHVKFSNSLFRNQFICDLCIKLQLDSYLGIKNKILDDPNEYWNKQKYCTSN